MLCSAFKHPTEIAGLLFSLNLRSSAVKQKKYDCFILLYCLREPDSDGWYGRTAFNPQCFVTSEILNLCSSSRLVYFCLVSHNSTPSCMTYIPFTFLSPLLQ